MRIFILTLFFIFLYVQSQPCNPPCNAGGICQNGHCVCRPGWTGINCLERACPNGRKVGQNCVCNAGWLGANCQTCTTPTACGAGRTCDNSYAIKRREKYLTCAVQGEFGGMLGANLTAHCDIPVGSTNGNCSIQTYQPINGLSQLFWCNMQGCSQDSDQEQTVWRCKTSQCHCTGIIPCPELLKNILERMKGSSDLTCRQNEDECEFFHDDMQLPIPVKCKHGECL